MEIHVPLSCLGISIYGSFETKSGEKYFNGYSSYLSRSCPCKVELVIVVTLTEVKNSAVCLIDVDNGVVCLSLHIYTSLFYSLLQ